MQPRRAHDDFLNLPPHLPPTPYLQRKLKPEKGRPLLTPGFTHLLLLGAGAGRGGDASSLPMSSPLTGDPRPGAGRPGRASPDLDLHPPHQAPSFLGQPSGLPPPPPRHRTAARPGTGSPLARSTGCWQGAPTRPRARVLLWGTWQRRRQTSVSAGAGKRQGAGGLSLHTPRPSPNV